MIDSCPRFSAARTSSAAVFFFNDTATTEIYTLSLHDALPIYTTLTGAPAAFDVSSASRRKSNSNRRPRSEEHTSELQSQSNLVCRLLLEKKKGLVTLPLLQRVHHESRAPNLRDVRPDRRVEWP